MILKKDLILQIKEIKEVKEIKGVKEEYKIY
mgnify:CR=1 FL=1